ncbi:MAG: penicillin acylase family protein [Sandaracinaceae bacterium]|nr:penicillin acylase family protein [Sandaracinaceae bacterium]
MLAASRSRSRVATRCLVLFALLSSASAPGCGGGQTEDQAAVLAVPETARLVLPTLRREVHVVRTEANIPHIYAQNERDLRVVQGYLAASDRYFAIEAGRRLGWGELSSLVGDVALSGDQQARGQGLAVVAQRILDQLTPAQLDTFEAYAEGVNAYIDAVAETRAEPPTELTLLRLVLPRGEPIMRHVTGRDLIGWLAAVTFQQGFDSLDVDRASVEARLDDAFTGSGLPNEALRQAGVVQDLWEPVRPVFPATTTPGFGLTTGAMARAGAGLTGPRSLMPRRGPGVPSTMLDRVLARAERWEDLMHGGRDEDFGSNVWAMTAGATEDGVALLSGDGHLPLTVPSLLYHTGLDTSVFGGGRDPLRQLGLYFAGIPFMGVGTNGHVAYSITYMYGDLTDWYREEIQLDQNGAPQASRFEGEWHPLVGIDEEYEIANVPSFGSVGRTEVWRRYTTFDGRLIAEMEGRVVDADTVAGPGETVINVQGDYIIPEDTDMDGVITAISFDYTGFDIANTVQAADGLGRAHDVAEMREASRRFVGFGQNVGAADTNGDVWYGSYNALPCRDNLRNADRTWADGGDPRSLLDGTRYGAFEIRLNDEGLPDETDPEHCLVPFEEWPMAISPSTGFIMNANNDIAGTTLDDDLTNDAWYIGYDFSSGYRANTISTRLSELASSQTGSLQAMRALQADHHSPVGRQLAPLAVAAITRARMLNEGDPVLTPDQQRLVDLYTASQSTFDEVETRLTTWLARGAQAESGVETFYETPTVEQREAAVATMIWNEWLRGMHDAIFGDEGIDFVFAPSSALRIKALVWLLEGRGANNPSNLSSWDPSTGESVFFDDVNTAEVERSDEVLLRALGAALGRLTAAPDPEEPGVGGFDTNDMSEWLWGLRHQVRFQALVTQFAGDIPEVALLGRDINTTRLPLMPDLPDTDPRASARWFPRHSDLYCVDAGHPPLTTGSPYSFGNGPVMRMVFRMEPGNVTGVNVVPGGQSAIAASSHFDDQARLWLANDVLPARFELADVLAGASGREVYSPR